MNIDSGALVIGFSVGIVLGILYMAALWWSVRHLPRARRPVGWLLAGMALRLTVLLGALYLLTNGQLERLLGALLGFLAVRLATTWWIKSPAAQRR